MKLGAVTTFEFTSPVIGYGRLDHELSAYFPGIGIPAGMSYYSLEDTINQFFSGRAVTREECDRIATELAREAVYPVPLQGAFSYTVAAGKLLVQFRDPESLLDTGTIDLARKIYGNVVPACVNRGAIGPSSSLAVYVMDKVPGITYIEAPSNALRSPSWQEQTVSDFAR